MSALPLREENNAFLNLEKISIQNAALKVAERENLLPYAEKLNGLEWQTPKDYIKGLQDYVRDLQTDNAETVKRKLKRQEMIEKVKNRDPAATAFFYELFMTTQGATFADVFADIKSSCNDIKPPGDFDVAIPTEKGILNIGWRTILHQNSTPIVVGHEIGHVIYRAARDGKIPQIQKRVACMAQKHLGTDKNASLHAEEDYADWFGAAIEKEMRTKFKGYDGFCFRERSTKLESEEPHSTNLFRAISAAAERGTLPKSCRDLSKEMKVPALISKCLD
jgi:hypothetical protein